MTAQGSHASPRIGGRPEDGEPSGRSAPRGGGTQHDNPEDERAQARRKPLRGTGSAQQSKPKVAEDQDALVDTESTIARFKDNSRARLKDSSRDQYVFTWKAFVRHAKLSRYSKRQLRGARGKRLLLDYLETVPKPSWQSKIAHLKAVWRGGLELEGFPLTKWDLPKLPPVGKRYSPEKPVVRVWADAMEKQDDLYLKVLWLLHAQLGLRPSHVAHLRWADVVRDAEGRPYGLDAKGKDGRFKSHADVRAWFPPDVAAAMDAWERATPARGADNPILPWKDGWGRFHDKEHLTRERIVCLWNAFRTRKRREGVELPKLNRVDLRHFVKSAGHDARMEEVALYLMQGQEPPGMAGQYDNPKDPEQIFDRQRSALPTGALGTLQAPRVEIVSGPTEAVTALVTAYMDGEMSSRDFQDRVEALRFEALKASAGQPFER